MVNVATFVISTLCNTPFRTSKPFNPLWCETFEMDRTYDRGWRAIAEQVSHHPPISAIHAEGNGWILDEDMCVRSNFQATAMKIFPEGTISIFFPATHSFYHWTMKDIKTCVKGFIIGPITVHNEGDCVIKDGRVIWTRKAPPPESELMYNFTAMAIELNEPEEGVAPTDSRLRPDMRLMENGDWAAANDEKARLEEKQRADTKKYQVMRLETDIQLQITIVIE
ncbi:unnamed protein product [Gongylonema pulchrum]|uniref:Oxysterol-binding protein n=1 Tax=Gongylonema pulchrum TaxID=637853 RepID=A0A183DY13_9BILA|nr:unnamed protein product [Gongylonema pulchrum]